MAEVTMEKLEARLTAAEMLICYLLHKLQTPQENAKLLSDVRALPLGDDKFSIPPAVEPNVEAIVSAALRSSIFEAPQGTV